MLRAEGGQRFAYRFSGADFALRISADQILPELTVSQVLAYNLGENELTIDAEFEVDVREAPLRELLLRVPRGYAVARRSDGSVIAWGWDSAGQLNVPALPPAYPTGQVKESLPGALTFRQHIAVEQIHLMARAKNRRRTIRGARAVRHGGLPGCWDQDHARVLGLVGQAEDAVGVGGRVGIERVVHPGREASTASGCPAGCQNAHLVSPEERTAKAPSSIGNLATGFDILGHTIEGPEDRVIVRRIDAATTRLSSVSGVLRELPADPERNTALRSLEALRTSRGLTFGFEVDIVKGIALGSGMGGSAASAVAALVAANALLPEPLQVEALYPYAVEGDAAASGGHHGDNVGPMLLGGLVLAPPDRLVRLPVPRGLTCVLVHPHLVLETRRAREALAGGYTIGEFVPQSAGLAELLVGCLLYTSPSPRDRTRSRMPSSA